MAVVVQQMISSGGAGVAFTADPSTGAEDRAVVAVAFGQGEAVVSGSVEPDNLCRYQEHRRNRHQKSRL
jgi:pyruvate,water dikinase